MTAADIWNFAYPYIQALAPAMLITAIVANTESLIHLVYRALSLRRY